MEPTTHTKLDVLHALWQKDYRLKALIPTLLCGLGAFFFHWALLGLLFFVLFFTVFDAIGFTELSARDTDDSPQRMAYRIIQVMVQFVTIMAVVSMCNWQAGLACMVAWWFTACDRLFYILEKDHSDAGDYTWLAWSVFWLLNFFGLKRTLRNFNTFSLIGMLLAIAITLV